MHSPVDTQRQIRENAESHNDFIRDLNIWKTEMELKEQKLKDCKDQKEELPSIRSKVDISSDAQSKEIFPPGTSSLNETSLNNIKDKGSGWMSENSNEQQRISLHEKELGNEAVKRNNWEGAILHYTEAIYHFPTDATYYANRALCYLKLNQLREAETDCTSALQLDGKYVKALHRRATIREKLNQIEEAYDDISRAVILDPNSVAIRSFSNKLKETIEKNMINIEKNTSKVAASNSTENKQKAEAYAEKEKGNRFVQNGRWPEAFYRYTNAIRLYPSDDVFYANRALCLLKLDKPKAALLDSLKAIEMNPTNIKAHHRKALAYVAVGNYEEAKQAFLECCKLDENNERVKKDLEKCIKKLNEKEEKVAEEKENKQSSSETTKRKPSQKITVMSSHNNISCASSSEENKKKCRYDGCRPSSSIPDDRVKEIISAIDTLPAYVCPSSENKDAEKRKEDLLKSRKNIEKNLLATKENPASPTIQTPDAQPETEKRKSYEKVNFGFKFAFGDKIKEKEKAEAEISVKNDKNSGIISNEGKTENAPCAINEGEMTIPAVPKTYFEFSKTLDALRTSSCSQYLYLRQIEAEYIPALCKDFLDESTFGHIIHVLASEFVPRKELVSDYLKYLSKTARFGTVILLIGEDTKKELRDLFDYCKVEEKRGKKLLKIFESFSFADSELLGAVGNSVKELWDDVDHVKKLYLPLDDVSK